MKTDFKKILFIVFFLTASSIVSNGQSNDAPVGFSDPAANDAPLDGGLAFVLAGAVGYGLKRIRSQKKGNAEEACK